MKPKTTEALAWVLIYSGLIVAALGLFLLPRQPTAAIAIMALGLIDAAAGVLLIWLRSRMPNDPTNNTRDPNRKDTP